MMIQLGRWFTFDTVPNQDPCLAGLSASPSKPGFLSLLPGSWVAIGGLKIRGPRAYTYLAYFSRGILSPYTGLRRFHS